MRDHAAISRAGLVPSDQTSGSPVDPRIHVTRAQLRALEFKARKLRFLPRQPASSVLNGRHASRLRGRGLNFEELRGYLPGDDPRSIDWKVTARTGEPHVRVYSEERDRPAFILVDQRMSMFFGTRHNMKSVTAAEAAAVAAFRILDQGDRVGGIVFCDEVISEVRPQRSRKAIDQLLLAIERANGLLHADAPVKEAPLPLNTPLRSLARIAKRDHLVIVISDFDGIDDKTSDLVGRISKHNDLILCPVTDPVSTDVPTDMTLAVSDGQLQVVLDTRDGKTHQQLQNYASGRLAAIMEWQRKFGVPVLPLSAGGDTVSQIQQLTGLGPRQRGGG